MTRRVKTPRIQYVVISLCVNLHTMRERGSMNLEVRHERGIVQRRGALVVWQ